MELHIDVYMRVHKIIEICQLKFWKFASKFTVNFTLNFVAEIAQNTAAFKAHVCMQVTFMFGGHIASKFAQIFTLKTEVR